MAQHEGADTEKVLLMGLVADLPEARLLNQTFIQKKYMDSTPLEERVLADQLRNLSGSAELLALHKELRECVTKEAQIASDARELETLIEAKEYMQQGITVMERWFLEKENKLKTATGKKLFLVLQKETLYWWKR